MALPEFSLRQLLEAGVHFGHQTQRWNPRMAEYIYGDRNGIHIVDLTQTVPLLDQALHVIRETVAKGGRVLFVGTKRQAQKPIAEAAEKCAQYYMNHRWLGGTLTNWKTVSQSIARLKEIDERMAEGAEGLTKRERLSLERERENFDFFLSIPELDRKTARVDTVKGNQLLQPLFEYSGACAGSPHPGGATMCARLKRSVSRRRCSAGRCETPSRAPRRR